jgi:hypothetical protein
VCVPKTNSFFGISSFALAGLGCSALLPLTISFGQKELTTIVAFGVGPLQTWARLDMNIIYGGTAAVALAMAAVSFVVTRKSSAPV